MDGLVYPDRTSHTDLRMMMPKSFENVEYYGCGPTESYNDKHYKNHSPFRS